jgi:quaternary ammonium compound-resistance protein SugE
MVWLLLIVGGGCEAAWVYFLKKSDGFTHLWPSVGFLLAAGASLVVLLYALRSLPIGTAYAVWTGLGAAFTATVGIVVLGELADVLRLASIFAVVLGVVGLRLAT